MSADASQIDPTARVDTSAKIGRDVTIGPYCIVGPDVEIGDGCALESHVQVTGHTVIGARTKIFPFAALGGAPQFVGYRGGASRLVVGADCVIREGVTMNCGSEEGGGLTEIGDHGFFMSYSHVAHDCRIGHHVVFANSAALGGHCIIGDYVFMGGLSAAHQFTWIGAHAMISGLTGIRGDIIPFALASGVPARVHGVNVVGMRRRGFSPESIRVMRNAYRDLFLGSGTLAERLEAVEQSYGSDDNVAALLAFVRGPRKRALCVGPGAKTEE
ncbi:MAG: acyl-ACP--UDP-N-acetylglucosamine O-acyltransferase [Xanthobacteraceae bacterium]